MFVLLAVSIAKSERLIVDFEDGTSITEAREISGLDVDWIHPKSADESLAFYETDQIDEIVKNLAGHPKVEAIEASVTYQTLNAPNDPLFPRQWNMKLIGVEDGLRVGGGQGTIVAVIDTGVAPVNDLSDAHLMEGVSFVVGETSWHDLNGHGTHVAGTIAQTTNNAFGAAGVAPNVDILPLKALGQYGSGQSEWIASAIDEAVDQGAQVINMSLGGSHSTVIEVATKKALKSGVLIVAAAGNTGVEGVSYPAAFEGVVAVSATGPNDNMAPYSTWGEAIDISAPGGDKNQDGGGILQQTLKSGAAEFLELQGTSMAAPHVAGSAAILMGAGAGTAINVKELLFTSAKDLGEEGWDNKYGHGRLDLSKSIEHLTFFEHLPRAGVAFFLAMLVAKSARQGFARFALLSVTSVIASGGLIWMSHLGPYFYPVLNYFPNPLWQSALPWMILSIALLPFNRLRWLGVGFCIAAGVHFIGGLFDQQLFAPIEPTIWFAVNVFLLCIPVALAILSGLYLEEES